MATKTRTRKTAPDPRPPGGIARWLCYCEAPPVLLATYDEAGRVNIKVRDRYWHCTGKVQTICPKCGQQHVLDRLD